MFGGKELTLLRQRKTALLLDSEVNRLALKTELDHLRAATGRATGALRSPKKLALPMLLLASLGGFFVARRGPGSVLKGLIWAAKWALPLRRVWKSLSAGAENP